MMKKTSFVLICNEEKLNEFLTARLPSYLEAGLIEPVELEQGGYTVYVEYDDTDVNIKELEECFMHVFMLDDYLDAWNMIHNYTE